MKEYNGHRSWNAWNVSLWLSNDYGLYEACRQVCRIHGIDKATDKIAAITKGKKTPDGAAYNKLSLRLALEGIMEE